MKYFLLFILCGSSAHAGEWSREDSYREAVYLTVHILDWTQTLNIARNPDKWHEKNPILGRHPSVGKVNAYFATTAAIHVGLAYLLPAEWRKTFQYLSIAVEGGVVAHNYSIGIKTDF